MEAELTTTLTNDCLVLNLNLILFERKLHFSKIQVGGYTIFPGGPSFTAGDGVG